jgi:hypothetical protein
MAYFWMKFESAKPSYARTIALDFTVEHNTRRIARICSTEFELWLPDDRGGKIGHRLAPLGSDIRGEVTEPRAQLLPEFKENQRSRCRLLWHYTPEQLQEVEDARAGGKVTFYVYARFTVQSVWPHPNEPNSVTHEIEAPGHEGGWPLTIEIAESDWIALLAKIAFKHPVLERMPWPIFPPAFSRAESHLNDAWVYYRKGDAPACLTSCFKAFECLGFDLFGKEVARKDVLDLLLAGVEPEKQQVVVLILRSMQNFFQFGRHDKHAPVSLSQQDAQMAVLCATSLLAYLAPQPSRAQSEE